MLAFEIQRPPGKSQRFQHHINVPKAAFQQQLIIQINVHFYVSQFCDGDVLIEICKVAGDLYGVVAHHQLNGDVAKPVGTVVRFSMDIQT